MKPYQITAQVTTKYTIEVHAKDETEAQATAEASAQEIQIASSGVQKAGSQTTAENRKPRMENLSPALCV